MLKFLLLLSIYVAYSNSADIVPCGKKCPSGFTHTFDGIPKCYTVVKKKMNWKDAQANCKTLHPKASLVMITGQLENQVINHMLKDIDCMTDDTKIAGSFWTCGRRSGSTCGSMMWQGAGGDYEPMTYTNFCPTEPSCTKSSTEDCMAIDKGCMQRKDTFGWNDLPCDKLRCSVCELIHNVLI